MQLVADAIAFAYPERPVFAGVDVRVADGTRLGVVGENGSGKSTLLQVLAGNLAPNAGTVRRLGSLTFVEQQLQTASGQRVGDLVGDALARLRATAAEVHVAADAIARPEGPGAKAQRRARLSELAAVIHQAERLQVWDADRRVDEALTRLGAPRDRDRPLATLSVGERYRVRLACALVEAADFLLLDEPTNHLDASAIDYLTSKIARWPGGVVLVTHDRQLLDDVATAILDLDPSMSGRPTLYGDLRGEVVSPEAVSPEAAGSDTRRSGSDAYRSGYDAYRAAKDQALARWRQTYAREQKRAAERAEILDASYEGLSDEWRPPKGSQKHRRATRARIHVKAADRAIEKLKAEAVDVPQPPLVLVFPQLPRAVLAPALPQAELAPALPQAEPPALLEAEPPVGEPRPPLVRLSNPLVAGRLDLRDSTISIPSGGRLLVVGPNGAGKSTLLQALAGRLPLDAGARQQDPGVRIGYLGQEDLQIAADPGLTGFDAAAQAALELLARGAIEPAHLHPIAGLGLLTEADLDRPLAQLSAGARRRFDLAKTLIAGPHLLVLDEPTNHLSVDLVDELTRELAATDAAVVLATHDRRMRVELADWPTLDLGRD